jgi:hypothetical protein
MSKKVAYSQELLEDTDALLREFAWFMSMNLIHADQNLPEDKAKKMRELMQYSSSNSRKLADFFKYPLQNHAQENRERLEKNINHLLKFIHDYIKYADKILEACRPDIHKDRFKEIKEKYEKYHHKYF